MDGTDEGWAAWMFEDLLEAWMVWEGRAARKGGRGGRRGDMEGMEGGCWWESLATRFCRQATLARSLSSSMGVLGGCCGCGVAEPASFVGAGVGAGVGGESLGGLVRVLACRR